tara:strand:- start:4010 stop:4195 length:186 start_codon:yes stop_codon:yes gene_type:complete
MKEMTNDYSKKELYISSYTNKKGIKKISINLGEELAVGLSNRNQKVLDAVIFELKEDLGKL